jgi:ATP-binding cassette subfamily B protein
MRFYDADDGKIEIGGRNITSYEKEELNSLFGVAMQYDFLAGDTIRENISFGRGLPLEEVERAARIAQADGFITAIKEGYEYTLAQKGTNLSGGQRQRLLIARAIAARPDILILDDSSSALDYKTDANLRRALKKELVGTTVITVAQRVSTIKDCDLILVIDNGRIIGKGKHDQLLLDCPEYKEISDSQMGGAFVE